MPPKRKKRVYENKALTRAAINLSDPKAYDTWRRGPRAAPYWDIFEREFLQSEQFVPGQKGAEFLNVYDQILLCERDGSGKYSSDGAETKLETALDWQAWLLLKLVHNNVSYRNGCLYGCTDSKSVIFEKMWNTIKNELRNRSRHAKNAKKAPKTTNSKKPNRTESSSESEAELDPHAGLALVTWINLPRILRKTVLAIEEFDNFCGYDLLGFRAAVEARFGLASHEHVILEMTETNNRGFRETQSEAVKEGSDGVFFSLKTRKAMLEQEVDPLPPPTVATPQAH